MLASQMMKTEKDSSPEKLKEIFIPSPERDFSKALEKYVCAIFKFSGSK